MDSGKDGFRKGGMQERKDSVKDELSFCVVKLKMSYPSV